MKITLEFDLSDALDVDWFEGDFGGDETTLSNKIVKGRKEHNCHCCDKTIKKGELHRSMTDRVDGQLDNYRWCSRCCAAAILQSQGHDAR